MTCLAPHVSRAFCSSIWCWSCDTGHHLSIVVSHSVFSPHPPYSPLFFHILFIHISVVSFFPVLFQVLSSVISFILFLHLPLPLYCFFAGFFFPLFFYFVSRVSWKQHCCFQIFSCHNVQALITNAFLWDFKHQMVGLGLWVMWIGRLRWGGEDGCCQDTRFTPEEFFTEIWKNCIIWEASATPRTYVYVRISVLGNPSVVHHDLCVEIYWNIKSPKIWYASSIPWYTGYYWLKQFDLS